MAETLLAGAWDRGRGRVSREKLEEQSEVSLTDRKSPARDERFWPDRQAEAALWKLGRGEEA